MVDHVQIKRSGLLVPTEVKNQKTLELEGGGNAAFNKFEAIANHGNTNQISHFEIIAHNDSKLPPGFRINDQGDLEREVSGDSGIGEWRRVEYGGKGVRIVRGPLGRISED
jgi:hypothetical protein